MSKSETRWQEDNGGGRKRRNLRGIYKKSGLSLESISRNWRSGKLEKLAAIVAYDQNRASKQEKTLGQKILIWGVQGKVKAKTFWFEILDTKGSFYTESVIRFLNLPVAKRTIFNKFKFQAQGSSLEYFSFWNWEIWKTNHIFWIKATFRSCMGLNPAFFYLGTIHK